jgi:hypothetical protein
MSAVIDLHLVCFDNPYPPDYGGVIDVFYKAEALKKAGIKVHGHIYHYGRKIDSYLEKTFTTISYYERKRSPSAFLSSVPFIVNTRKSESLKNTILKEKAVVLCEGIHTTAFLPNWVSVGIPVFVRSHNIEHLYYQELLKQTKPILKKVYYGVESQKLKRYESVLKQANGIASISSNELSHFTSLNSNTVWVPPFHGFKFQDRRDSSESFYALFHGNFNVEENISAAKFLVENVFNELNIPLWLAGKNANNLQFKSERLEPNIRVINNPSDAKLLELLRNAGVHVLAGEQKSGIKLKLLAALHTPVPVVCSAAMVEGTGLGGLVHIASSKEEWKKAILQTSNMPSLNIDDRKRALHAFQNSNSLNVLQTLLFSGK